MTAKSYMVQRQGAPDLSFRKLHSTTRSETLCRLRKSYACCERTPPETLWVAEQNVAALNFRTEIPVPSRDLPSKPAWHYMKWAVVVER
jgi:hypothetical protein